MKVFRLWYYFRAGYVNYDNLGLSLLSSFIVIYKLGLAQISWFANFFPHLSDFLLVAIIVSIPLNIGLGAFHASRRRGPLNSEIEVSMLTNPFMYRAIPGKEVQLMLPVTLLSLEFIEDFYKSQNTLTKERQEEIARCKGLVSKLLNGGETR